jgi:dienelactone hydrolase
MDPVITEVAAQIAEYGILALVAYMLYRQNQAMQKRNDELLEKQYQMQIRVENNIIDKLEEVSRNVETGLTEMRQKYQEERLERISRHLPDSE